MLQNDIFSVPLSTSYYIVVAAVKEFYLYLYGRLFTLYTNHNHFTSPHGIKDTGGRLTSRLLYLQQFDINVLYRPGRSHELSRRPEVNREQVSEVYGIYLVV